MSVSVTTLTETIQHADATTWHVDDQGILHVIAGGTLKRAVGAAGGGDDSAVATYAKDQWSSVTRIGESGCQCRKVAEAVTEAISRGWTADRR